MQGLVRAINGGGTPTGGGAGINLFSHRRPLSGPGTRLTKKLSHTKPQHHYEGWGKVSQEHINKRVLSMPNRFRDVIAMDGAMAGN